MTEIPSSPPVRAQPSTTRGPNSASSRIRIEWPLSSTRHLCKIASTQPTALTSIPRHTGINHTEESQTMSWHKGYCLLSPESLSTRHCPLRDPLLPTPPSPLILYRFDDPDDPDGPREIPSSGSGKGGGGKDAQRPSGPGRHEVYTQRQRRGSGLGVIHHTPTSSSLPLGICTVLACLAIVAATQAGPTQVSRMLCRPFGSSAGRRTPLQGGRLEWSGQSPLDSRAMQGNRHLHWSNAHPHLSEQCDSPGTRTVPRHPSSLLCAHVPVCPRSLTIPGHALHTSTLSTHTGASAHPVRSGGRTGTAAVIIRWVLCVRETI